MSSLKLGFFCSLLTLIFGLVDEGSKLLRNIGKSLPDYTGSHFARKTIFFMAIVVRITDLRGIIHLV
jgi:hypothetical protein